MSLEEHNRKSTIHGNIHTTCCRMRRGAIGAPRYGNHRETPRGLDCGCSARDPHPSPLTMPLCTSFENAHQYQRRRRYALPTRLSRGGGRGGGARERGVRCALEIRSVAVLTSLQTGHERRARGGRAGRPPPGKSKSADMLERGPHPGRPGGGGRILGRGGLSSKPTRSAATGRSARDADALRGARHAGCAD